MVPAKGCEAAHKSNGEGEAVEEVRGASEVTLSAYIAHAASSFHGGRPVHSGGAGEVNMKGWSSSIVSGSGRSPVSSVSTGSDGVVAGRPCHEALEDPIDCVVSWS